MVVFDLLGRQPRPRGCEIEGFELTPFAKPSALGSGTIFKRSQTAPRQSASRPCLRHQRSHTTTNRLRIHCRSIPPQSEPLGLRSIPPARRLLGSGRWKFGVAVPLRLAVKWDGDSMGGATGHQRHTRLGMMPPAVTVGPVSQFAGWTTFVVALGVACLSRSARRDPAETDAPRLSEWPRAEGKPHQADQVGCRRFRAQRAHRGCLGAGWRALAAVLRDQRSQHHAPV